MILTENYADKKLLTNDKQPNGTLRRITLSTDQLTLMADRMGMDFDEEDEDGDC